MALDEVVSQVGLWWPAADEDALQSAAAAWERAAGELDRAAEVGRAGATRARGTWAGEAADRFTVAWVSHETVLHDDAAGCRALAEALRRYAAAVEAAKAQVRELAVTAGATIVAGVGLAWLTFGVSAAAAAGVSAGLVAAAAAIGVELSATAAAIVGGVVVGAVFGAVEAAAVDLAVTQPLRVEGFGHGGYSAAEAAGAAATGGLFGGVLGGVVGGLARPARTTVADDLADLDGRISAALDPATRGSLGPLFRAGVHETPAASFAPHQLPGARLLEDQGFSVHARTDTGALVRTDPADRGRIVEITEPEVATAEGVEAAVLEASGRLARQGRGELLVDGRAIGLDVEVGGAGLVAAVLRARAEGLELPSSVQFVFDGDVSVFWP